MNTREFYGRQRLNKQIENRLPPGQYLTKGFPVLSAGPSPNTSRKDWDFRIENVDGMNFRWDWEEFLKLPAVDLRVDIHCVTKWSKLDTNWRGILLDTLLDACGIKFSGNYVMAFCDGGYTTNISLGELLNGKSLLAFELESDPISTDHGGPVRLIVPRLYFWKSAKWIRAIKFMDEDRPGFWEEYGYHMLGDPWKEQRYWGD